MCVYTIIRHSENIVLSARARAQKILLYTIGYRRYLLIIVYKQSSSVRFPVQRNNRFRGTLRAPETPVRYVVMIISYKYYGFSPNPARCCTLAVGRQNIIPNIIKHATLLIHFYFLSLSNKFVRIFRMTFPTTSRAGNVRTYVRWGIFCRPYKYNNNIFTLRFFFFLSFGNS